MPRTKSNNKAKGAAGQPAANFADFCRTARPHQLGLNPDAVARVCRAMSAPEMGAITTTDGLRGALRHLRPFYGDELSWSRFLLTARFMWLVHRGRVWPPGNTTAAGRITAKAAGTTTIARGKAVRS